MPAPFHGHRCRQGTRHHVAGFPVIPRPLSLGYSVLAPSPSLTQLLFPRGPENLPWKLLKAVVRGGYTESGGSPQAGDRWCLWQEEDVVLGVLYPAALGAASTPALPP